MTNELLYHEYAGWKLEHSELLENLKELDSPLVIRFENVLSVTDYLYDKLIDDTTYSEEDHEIFQTGFYYIYDQIEEIIKLLKEVYNNDFNELNNNSRKINLLLNTIDFQNEILSQESYDEKGLQFLLDFEQDIISKIKTNKEIDEKTYELFDMETLKIFKKMEVEFYPIDTIFYEIADELGLI